MSEEAKQKKPSAKKEAKPAETATAGAGRGMPPNVASVLRRLVLLPAALPNQVGAPRRWAVGGATGAAQLAPQAWS